jgi:competence protein ComEC
MPVGLEAIPLAVMAWGIEMLLSVAAFVASLPGADVRPPPIAAFSLCLIACGLLWLCLWRLRWRLLGLPAIALGLLVIPLLIDPPDILVAPDGSAVAVRDAAGTLRISGARAGSYVVEQFFDEERDQLSSGAELRMDVRCDETACLLVDAGGHLISHVTDPAAFPEDCVRAAVIATALTAPEDCGARLVIDRPRLATFGAHAVRIGGASDVPEFEVTTELTGYPRPWQGWGGR